jgi:hypothetical protein
LHGRRRWSSRNTTHRPPTLPVPCSLPHRPASRASSLPCRPLHYCTASRPNRRRIHRQCDSAHLHYAELPLLDPPSHRRIDDGHLPYSLSLYCGRGAGRSSEEEQPSRRPVPRLVAARASGPFPRTPQVDSAIPTGQTCAACTLTIPNGSKLEEQAMMSWWRCLAPPRGLPRWRGILLKDALASDDGRRPHRRCATTPSVRWCTAPFLPLDATALIRLQQLNLEPWRSQQR